ncbi:hypothetical protein MMC15_002596 [Xylographa vitiligo]|nr:hypothetical protein [Xylographa vitiligo]
MDMSPIEVENAPEKFNSAFHKPAEVTTGEERATCEPTYYGPWLPLITATAGRAIQDVVVLDINNHYASVLVYASKAGTITGRIPGSELEELTDYFEKLVPPHFPKEGWFLRLEDASPKDGLDKKQPIRLYLIPFNKSMDTSREFRIFCSPRGHISAVSQYKWFRGTTWDDEEIRDIGEGAQQLHQLIMSQDNAARDEIRRQGFVFDMLYTPSHRHVFQLVELNHFGALTGCGSCLFRWIRDRELLYAGNGGGAIPFAVSRFKTC